MHRPLRQKLLEREVTTPIVDVLLHASAVFAALRRMPVAHARTTWSERVKGPPEVRAVLREFIAIARASSGEVAALAADLIVVGDGARRGHTLILRSG